MPLFSKLISADAITDLVWIQTGFIGDILLTTGAMARARELMPTVRQHVITTATGKAVLEHGFATSSLHVFDKSSGMGGILQTARQVRKKLGTHTVTIKPHLSTRSSLLALALGKPFITFCESSLACFAATQVPRVSVLHESDRNAILLEALGFARGQLLGAKPKLTSKSLPFDGPFAPLQTQAGIDGKLLKWIAVAPGSIWGTKRWPVAKFTTLVQRIIDEARVGIVLIGGKDEKNLCDQIVEATLRTRPQVAPRLVNSAGQTALDDLRALFPALSLVITNDSSPVHYASAFDIPTVVIFGPTIPAFGFGPLAKDSVVIEKKGLACRPCGNHGPQRCPLDHFNCMNQLEVEEVYQASVKIIGRQ